MIQEAHRDYRHRGPAGSAYVRDALQKLRDYSFQPHHVALKNGRLRMHGLDGRPDSLARWLRNIPYTYMITTSIGRAMAWPCLIACARVVGRWIPDRRGCSRGGARGYCEMILHPPLAAQAVCPAQPAREGGFTSALLKRVPQVRILPGAPRTREVSSVADPPSGRSALSLVRAVIAGWLSSLTVIRISTSWVARR
jgi:hypothetical protein